MSWDTSWGASFFQSAECCCIVAVAGAVAGARAPRRQLAQIYGWYLHRFNRSTNWGNNSRLESKLLFFFICIAVWGRMLVEEGGGGGLPWLCQTKCFSNATPFLGSLFWWERRMVHWCVFVLQKPNCYFLLFPHYYTSCLDIYYIQLKLLATWHMPHLTFALTSW